MISVIVPIYKAEKYLRECVNSIINQTYKDLEIILVDDGSPDNCGKICDELSQQDKRIVVIHQENTGQSVARNAGLAVKNGEYVAFVDSDDTIEAQMYETLLAMIENEQGDIAICGHRIVEENSIVEAKSLGIHPTEILGEKDLWEEVFGKLNNSACNKLYRSSLLEGLEFQEGMIHGEDLIFNLNYLTRCKKGIINRTQMYNYLKRKGSVTKSLFSKKRFSEIISKDVALELVKKYAPNQVPNAEKYCFRARMNVLRAIYKAQVEGKYVNQVKGYKQYVKKNYKRIKKTIRTKEKLEYIMCVYCPVIYGIILKR